MGFTAALLTSTSILPYESMASLTSFLRWSLLPTWHAQPWQSMPCPLRDFRLSSTFFCLREQMTTCTSYSTS